MKLKKRVVAVLTCLTMVSVGFSNSFVAEENETKEAETQDSWVDLGNYTRGWFDVVTGRDIYGNEGTKEDPYEVKSEKDLAGLSYYSNITGTDSVRQTLVERVLLLKRRSLTCQNITGIRLERYRSLRQR